MPISRIQKLIGTGRVLVRGFSGMSSLPVVFPNERYCISWPITDIYVSMVTDQSPDRVHSTGSETKYRVFNNKITVNVDIYHSEATTLKQKACTMKYTKNTWALTVTTHIQPRNPEIIYEHLPYCAYQPYSFKCNKYISMVT